MEARVMVFAAVPLLTVTLLAGIGKSVDVHQMEERHVLAALSFLRNADLRSCA